MAPRLVTTALRMLAACAVFLGFMSPGISTAALAVQNSGGTEPYRISWADGDRLIITKSRIGEIRIWDAATGHLLQTPPAGAAMGSNIVTGRDGTTIAFSHDGRVTLWDIKAGKILWQAQSTDQPPIGPHDGKSIILAGGAGLKRISIANNEVLASWKPAEGFCHSIHPLSGGAVGVVMSDRDAYILDGETLQQLKHIRRDVRQPFYQAKAAGNNIVLTTVAGILVADIQKPEAGYRRITKGPAVHGIALSADGMKTAMGTPRGIEIRNSGNNEIQLTHPLEMDVNDMAWSEDGTRIAIATADKGVVIIDAEKGNVLGSFCETLSFRSPPQRTMCAFSRDGKSSALIDEKKRLRICDLVTGSIVISPVGMPAAEELEIMEFDGGGDLIISSHRQCSRIGKDGRLTASIEGPPDSVGSGMCGPDGIWFRNKDGISIHRWAVPNAIESGGFPVPVARRCEFTADGRFALVMDNADDTLFSIRMAPDWNIVHDKIRLASAPEVGTLSADAKGEGLTFIDGRSSLVHLDVRTKESRIIHQQPMTQGKLWLKSPAQEDWLIESPAADSKSTYRVVSRSSGETVHENQPWQSFTDELYQMPVAVTPDRKHLWLCGMSGHPVLVNLENGKPLLRVHTWIDGGVVFERPDGRFFANDKGIPRILSVDMNAGKAEFREELVREAFARDEILKLLESVNTPP